MHAAWRSDANRCWPTEVGDGNFPGSPASGLWWPRGSLIQGPLQGHAVSRDLVHWSHLPVALWNDQPFDSVAVYTGSATVVNGSVAIIYPGVCDGARAGTNPGPVVWPTCSADGAHHCKRTDITESRIGFSSHAVSVI